MPRLGRSLALPLASPIVGFARAFVVVLVLGLSIVPRPNSRKTEDDADHDHGIIEIPLTTRRT